MTELILNYPIKRFKSNIRLDLKFPNKLSRWVVWSYCGFKKNVRIMSQPNVVVAFREIKEGNILSEIILRYVALTLIGEVKIGSIWCEGHCDSIIAYPKEYFTVNFSESGWRISSFLFPDRSRKQPPYPSKLYPLKYENDQNWYIEFSLRSGGVLVIPCLEFFYRCFGRSGEVKRLITTYPWDIAVSRIIGDFNAPKSNDLWKVKLGKGLVDNDAIFAAHIKHDKVAADAAKWIYTQIESNYNYISNPASI